MPPNNFLSVLGENGNTEKKILMQNLKKINKPRSPVSLINTQQHYIFDPLDIS
jgi:hypothetical protein